MDDIQQDEDFNAIKKQLEKYVKKPTPARKGKITIAINALELKCKYPPKLVIEAISGLIEDFEEPGETMFLLRHWSDRLQGAPIIPSTSQSVYGKWYSDQVLAEALPLDPVSGDFFNHGKRGFKVDLDVRTKECSLDWERRGFAEAEPLPVSRDYGCQAWCVEILKNKREMIQYGFAESSPLQWRRQIERPAWMERQSNQDRPPEYRNTEEDRPGFYVERSILAFGFWKAYRWWAGCRDWYYDKHPDWFWDDPVWGESEVIEAVIPEGVIPEGAAVISPQSLALFQRLNVTG